MLPRSTTSDVRYHLVNYCGIARAEDPLCVSFLLVRHSFKPPFSFFLDNEKSSGSKPHTNGKSFPASSTIWTASRFASWWMRAVLVHWNPTDLWVDFTSFDRNLWGSSPQWDHILFKSGPSILIWASAYLHIGNLTIYWPVCKPFQGQWGWLYGIGSFYSLP